MVDKLAEVVSKELGMSKDDLELATALTMEIRNRCRDLAIDISKMYKQYRDVLRKTPIAVNICMGIGPERIIDCVSGDRASLVLMLRAQLANALEGGEDAAVL